MDTHESPVLHTDTAGQRTLTWIEHNGQSGLYTLTHNSSVIARGVAARRLFDSAKQDITQDQSHG